MRNNMETAAGRLGRVVAIRMAPGVDLLEGLQEACEQYGIKNGAILSAIGSLNGVVFCNPVEMPIKAGYGYGEDQRLTGPIELTSATGVICHDDEGAVNLHVHVTLTDRHGGAHGGHLRPGSRVLLNLDAVIAEIDGVEMARKLDEELGVPRLSPRQEQYGNDR